MNFGDLLRTIDEIVTKLRQDARLELQLRDYLKQSAVGIAKTILTINKENAKKEYDIDFEGRWRLVDIYLEFFPESMSSLGEEIEMHLQRLSLLCKKVSSSEQLNAYYRNTDLRFRYGMLSSNAENFKSMRKNSKKMADEALEAGDFRWYCHFQLQMLGLAERYNDGVLLFSVIGELMVFLDSTNDENALEFKMFLCLQKLLWELNHLDSVASTAADFEAVLCGESTSKWNMLRKTWYAAMLIRSLYISDWSECSRLVQQMTSVDTTELLWRTEYISVNFLGAEFTLQLPWNGTQLQMVESLLLGTFYMQQEPQKSLKICLAASQAKARDGSWNDNCQLALRLLLAKLYLIQGELLSCREQLEHASELFSADTTTYGTAVYHCVKAMYLMASASFEESISTELVRAEFDKALLEIPEGKTLSTKLAYLVYAQLCILYLSEEQPGQYLSCEKLLEDMFALLKPEPTHFEQALFSLAQALNALADSKVKHTKVKALEVIKLSDSCGSFLLKTFALCAVGCLYVDVQPQQAEKMFKASYGFARKLSLQPASHAISFYLSKVYTTLRETQQAVKYESRAKQHLTHFESKRQQH